MQALPAAIADNISQFKSTEKTEKSRDRTKTANITAQTFYCWFESWQEYELVTD